MSTLFIYKKVGLVLGDLKKEVLTDSKWLQFVVAQLLTNAVKYTPSGSVSVWCEGEVLYIRDTESGSDRKICPGFLNGAIPDATGTSSRALRELG